MAVGLIGGTGFAVPADASPLPTETPFGPVVLRKVAAWPDVLFVDRHDAAGARLLPHEVNYRANLWALREHGVRAVLAVYAVGGIAPALQVGDLVLPRQIIDYTWGREHTFATGACPRYIDFRDPFHPAARQAVLRAATAVNVAAHDGGVYGATQGPRLETAAEIDRLDRDGCTVVGMTAMPEAALARELDLPMAGICLVVNAAAGRGPPGPTAAGVGAVVARAQAPLDRLLRAGVAALATGSA